MPEQPPSPFPPVNPTPTELQQSPAAEPVRTDEPVKTLGEHSTEELVSELIGRYRNKKAKLIAAKAPQKFQALVERLNPTEASRILEEAIEEVADGQIRASFAVEQSKR